MGEYNKLNGSLDKSENLGLRKKLTFLAKDSFIYGSAVVINAALMLLTIPLLTRNFSVEDYGMIDFFTSVSTLAVVLFVFGQDSAVARFFFEYNEEAKKKQVVSQSFFLQVLLLLLFIPILWYMCDSLIESKQNKEIVKLVLLQVPFFLLINFSQNILKWTFARKHFLIISVGSGIFSLLILFLGITYYSANISDIFLVYLLTRLVFGLLGLWFVRKLLTYPKNWSFLKNMMPYALPYGIIGVISIGIPIIERSFILEFLTGYDLGLYSTGLKVAMIIALPIQAFQLAWTAFFLSTFKDKTATVVFNWIFKFFSIFIFILVIFVTAFSHFFINLLASDDYAGASVVVFAVSMGLAIQATGWITEIGIDLSKKSYLKLYGFIFSLIVSLGCMYFLIQEVGLSGAGWGALFGYLTKTIIDSWLAERIFPLGWEYKGVLIVGTFTLILGASANILAYYNLDSESNFLLIMGLFLIPIFGWLYIFSKNDREKIRANLLFLTKRV